MDVAPGRHQVTASTEVTKTITVTAQAGRTTYVRCSIGIGILVGHPDLVQVAAEQASQEVGSLSYTGQY